MSCLEGSCESGPSFPGISRHCFSSESERASWHSALSLHSNQIPVAILPTLSAKNQEIKKNNKINKCCVFLFAVWCLRLNMGYVFRLFSATRRDRNSGGKRLRAEWDSHKAFDSKISTWIEIPNIRRSTLYNPMSQNTLAYKLVGILLNKNCVRTPRIILLYPILLNMLSIRLKKFIFKD